AFPFQLVRHFVIPHTLNIPSLAAQPAGRHSRTGYDTIDDTITGAAMNLQSTLEITLLSVEPVQIHGSAYYDIRYQQPGSEEVRQMRINPEAFYPDPRPGDRVAVNMVMGNIMGARRLS